MNFNVNALFSDETAEYRLPVEPAENEKVVIKFRAGKDEVSQVFFTSGEMKYLMEKYETDDYFDFYRIEIQLGTGILEYCFEIHVNDMVCYYHKTGVSTDRQECCLFGIVPGFHTPQWAKGAVMYQLFVERFYNGDETNDPMTREYIYIKEGIVNITDWDKYPSPVGIREFYGGDLQGVLDKLDYLEKLGVEVIYFNPLFVSPSNHKYDIQDYDYIDPHFGVIINDGGDVLEEADEDNIYATKYIERVTNRENLEASNQLFIRLAEEIHKRGMKVILDGVFNHCGSFNKWLDGERIYENEENYEKGAYISEESPYRSFFKFNNENAWPYNSHYDGWWGHSTLPKLNYEESPELFRYIMEIGRKWVGPPFHADGWRLDVAADLGHSPEYNHYFWKEFRKAIKEINPDAIILAEHYGDPKQWLLGDEWDSVMNYDAFMEPVTWFLTGMQKHSDEYREDLLGNGEAFAASMNYHMSKFHGPSLYTAMNQLSNHDHSRFLTRTNKKVGRTETLGAEAANTGINKGIFREAAVIQMTWPGAPTVYYGDEAGVCGFTDPDNRRTYPWGKEDYELIEFHKEIIRIHKANKVLSYGSLKMLRIEYNFIAYGRFDKNNQIVVVVNNNSNDVSADIPVWEIGVPKTGVLEQIMSTTETGYSIGILAHEVADGNVTVRIPKVSSVILRRTE